MSAPASDSHAESDRVNEEKAQEQKISGDKQEGSTTEEPAAQLAIVPPEARDLPLTPAQIRELHTKRARAKWGPEFNALLKEIRQAQNKHVVNCKLDSDIVLSVPNRVQLVVGLAILLRDTYKLYFFINIRSMTKGDKLQCRVSERFKFDETEEQYVE